MCNRSFGLAIATAFMIACSNKNDNKSDVETVIIEGNYKEILLDTLRLHNHLGKEHYIVTDEKGFFSDTLAIAQGYYQLSHKYKTLIKELYLEKGFQLSITIKGSNDYNLENQHRNGYFENAYLAQKNIINQPFEDIFTVVKERSENNFLRFCDSIHNLELNLFHENEIGMSDNFVEFEKINLQSERFLKISEYPGIKYYISNTRTSNTYPNVYTLPIDYNKDAYMASDNAYYFLNSYIKYQVTKLEDSIKLSYNHRYWNWVNEHISNLDTSNHFLFNNGLGWMQLGVNMDSIYGLMIAKFSESKMIEKIQEVYNDYKSIERGQQAPNFQLPDRNGNIVSLEEFRGKIVYIDFWGTYCKPCFNLMPALNKLEEHFQGKDIVFVGIGMDKDDALWLKRIEQFKMGGIQLRSESREHPFLQHFKVFGIPRFVLLDREGKIVDAYAKYPDDPELTIQLEHMLQ